MATDAPIDRIPGNTGQAAPGNGGQAPVNKPITLGGTGPPANPDIQPRVDPKDPIDQATRAPAAVPDAQVIDQWLNSVYLEIDRGNVQVRDFLNIGKTEGKHSYLRDDVIDVALGLLTSNGGPPGVAFITTTFANQLCQVGLGHDVGLVLPATSNGAINPEIDVMRDEENRWVMIPCNDGMMGDHDREEVIGTSGKETGEGSTNNQGLGNKDGRPWDGQTQTNVFGQNNGAATGNNGQESTTSHHRPDSLNVPKSSGHAQSTAPVGQQNSSNVPGASKFLGTGSHWGLLIIDKKNNVAHWIDGLLTIEEGETGDRIAHMLRAGVAAGKVLCGYDALMEHFGQEETDQFNATTLKYVPHQHDDNFSERRDDGACGPYTYAFLKYLYENHNAMQDLPTAFSKTNRLVNRAGLNFHSKNIRTEIQTLIDEQLTSNSRDGKPVMLTLQALNILTGFSPDDISARLSDFLSQGRADKRRRGSNSSSGSDSSSSGGSTPGNGGGGPITNLTEAQWLKKYRKAVDEGQIERSTSFEQYMSDFLENQIMADSLLGTALQGQKDPEDGNVVTEIGAKKNGNLIQRGDTNPPTGPEDSGNQSGSTTNAQAGAHTTTTLTDTRGQSGGDTTTQQGVKPSQTIPSEPSLQPSPVAELPQSIDFLWGYNHSQIRRWAEELNKVDESLDPKMDLDFLRLGLQEIFGGGLTKLGFGRREMNVKFDQFRQRVIRVIDPRHRNKDLREIIRAYDFKKMSAERRREYLGFYNTMEAERQGPSGDRTILGGPRKRPTEDQTGGNEPKRPKTNATDENQASEPLGTNAAATGEQPNDLDQEDDSQNIQGNTNEITNGGQIINSNQEDIIPPPLQGGTNTGGNGEGGDSATDPRDADPELEKIWPKYVDFTQFTEVMLDQWIAAHTRLQSLYKRSKEKSVRVKRLLLIEQIGGGLAIIPAPIRKSLMAEWPDLCKSSKAWKDVVKQLKSKSKAGGWSVGITKKERIETFWRLLPAKKKDWKKREIDPKTGASKHTPNSKPSPLGQDPTTVVVIDDHGNGATQKRGAEDVSGGVVSSNQTSKDRKRRREYCGE